MGRKRLKFKPSFDGSLKIWTQREILRQLWRFSGEHDPDDLLQEAFIIFYYCARMYPNIVDPPHFMSIYKMALTQRFHDMANKLRFQREYVVHDHALQSEDGLISLIDSLGSEQNLGPIMAAFGELPEVVKKLFWAFDSPALLEGLRAKPKKGRRKNGLCHRETRNQFLCRVLGLDPKKVQLEVVARKLLQGVSET